MSVADRRDWTYTRRADGSEWTTMPREDFKELMTGLPEDVRLGYHNAEYIHAGTAVWLLAEYAWREQFWYVHLDTRDWQVAEARWWAEELSKYESEQDEYAWAPSFPWEVE